jgi:AcrR family transcriptional regulator
MTPAETTERKTADERRDQVLDAAIAEFAQTGLHGTSTERIAQRVGLSQPYLFRLFDTKKQIFAAAIDRCFRETLELFRQATEGVPREQALSAMGMAYATTLLPDRTRLLGQMHAYAACDDEEIRAVVRRGFGDLYEFVERVSGANDEEVMLFFARGMLLNVMTAMDVPGFDAGWARRLSSASGCDPGC